MVHLGPTGRTKTTEDPSPVRRPVAEIGRPHPAIVLLKWAFVATVTGLCLWILAVSVITMTQRGERDRRIEACVSAMASQRLWEADRAPIPQCEPLSDAERREAAYVYAKREGLL